jgi:cytochrome c5
MRLRYRLITIFAVIQVLLAACSTPPSTVAQTNSLSDVGDALVERVEVQADAGGLISATTEPVTPQVTPLQDGLSLLESRCTQCHIAQWLMQIKKPRAKWEKTLAQMEAMGVHLDNSEKAVLLDYLALAD